MASSEPFASRPREMYASGALNGCRRGAGEPMVLLHGGGGSWRHWSPVLPALAQEFEVIALDLPGFGESPSPPGAPVTIPSHADAIERELDTADCPTAHLVGNSSGGWLALELARRGRARSVVAIAPDGMSSRVEDLYRHLVVTGAHHAARFIHRHPALTATTARRWLLNWWLFMAHPGRWSADEANAAMHDLANGPGYLELLDWVRGRRIEGLADITCRVLIAWGSRDLLLPRWQAQRFVEALPDGLGEVKLLRGVGHLPMADNADLIASTIIDFARGHRALASR
jgi:pimeloyl-ACP methyl ester carboxylesterase